MGQFNLSRIFPELLLNGGGGGRSRWGSSPSSPWKIKEAVKSHQDPRLMERLESSWTPGSSGQSQAGSLAGLAASASMCDNVGGRGHPGNAGEPSGLGRQDPASSLGPETRATLALQELGWPPRVGQGGSWAQTQRRPRPRSLPLDLNAGILRVRRLRLRGWLLGGPVEMDHIQVGVGEGVFRRGRPDGLNAGILRVVVGLGRPGGRLLPLGQVQVCVCDVIVVLDLNEIERRSFWSP